MKTKRNGVNILLLISMSLFAYHDTLHDLPMLVPDLHKNW